MALTDEDKNEIRLIVLNEIDNINLAINENIEITQKSDAVKQQAGIVFNIIRKGVMDRRTEIKNGK